MGGRLQTESKTWRWAAASVRGTAHANADLHSQDAYAVTPVANGVVFAVVSDGAGSTRLGGVGARYTCYFMKNRVRAWFESGQQFPDDAAVVAIIHDLRKALSAHADKRRVQIREYAATMAAVLVSNAEVLTIQVGDSSIVARKGNDWEVLCWPDAGEYASTTYFITDLPHARLNIKYLKRSHDAFALFSDGIGELALSVSDASAFPGFFRPMMRPLDDALDSGHLSDLSDHLSAYLGSQSFCERTDDDKTLILITGG